MKNFTLIAALTVASVAANAQYTAETPYLEPIATNANNDHFDVIFLNESAMSQLQAAGKKVQEIGPDDQKRNLWYWDDTFVNGEAAMALPGVGWSEQQMNYEAVMCVNVGTVGWSGLGYAIDKGAGVDFTHFTEKTRFHMAFKTIATPPASVAVILLDGEGLSGNNAPAKIAVGDPFVDNGAVYPAVAPKLTEDWVAVDISFSDIKKIYPTFDYENDKSTDWAGNVLSLLGGGVTGQNICWDATYFYTPGDGDGVDNIAADNYQILYTGNTINAAGAKGITLYDLAGNAVRTSASSVLGTDGLAKGIYVVKAGNSVQKIVVR